MKIRFCPFIMAAIAVFSVGLFAQQRANGLVEGKVWFWDAMADNPGICVTAVDRYLVDYRVECTTPGFVTVTWNKPCRLQVATELKSNPAETVWTDVAGATSPLTVPVPYDFGQGPLPVLFLRAVSP